MRCCDDDLRPGGPSRAPAPSSTMLIPTLVDGLRPRNTKQSPASFHLLHLRYQQTVLGPVRIPFPMNHHSATGFMI
jgi:hypothetical protein